MSNDEIRKNIGHATSYGYAKSTGRLPEGMDEDAYAELMADYVTVGQTAVAAKNAAVAAKDAAETAAGTATTKAAEASQSATTATNAANAAQADADAAALDASQAMSAASTATTKASEASQSATTATNAKNDAVTAKTAAQAAQTAAETAEDNAETSATAAAASAASVAESAAQIQTNAEDISQLKSDLNVLQDKLYNELSASLTQNASTYFNYPMFVGEKYYIQNTSASGDIALATRHTPSGTDVESISAQLSHGNSMEFVPSYDTPILRVYCNASGGTFKIYQEGTLSQQFTKLQQEVANISVDTSEIEIAEGYIQIPSITATKQQYINTGINYDGSTGFEIEFEMYSSFGQSGVFGNVIGSRIASGNKDLELNTFNTTATGLFRYGDSSHQKAGNIVREKRIRCSWINNVYTVYDVENKTVIHTSTANNAVDSDNGYPLFIFALNNGGTATALAWMKLYSAKIYSGSSVVANMIPVYNVSTGKTGLYDTVRNAFYGDANGGDFEADYGLALQVRMNTDDIDELKNGTADAGTVYESELASTIEAYQTVLTASGVPMLTMPIFTDLHHDAKYTNDPTIDMFANIKKLISYLHCDALCNLGDAIDGQNQTKLQAETALGEVINKMYSITDRSHNLEGNHDSNVQSTWEQYGGITGAKLTLPELYDALNKGSENEVHDFTTRLTNYYMDFDQYNLRVICLGVNYVTFTEDTKTWLENVALDTDKPVIVLAHCPTRAEWGYNNDVQNGVAYVEAPLKAFVQNGGKVIVYIHGHTHGDKISTADDLPFAEVSIGCAKYETLSSGTTGATYQARNANNYTKILFDLVCIDQTNEEVHFIRYGAGSDRYISY